MIKKINIKLRIFLIIAFIMQFQSYYLNAQDTAYITEIASGESNGKDWIELYFVDDYSVNGMRLYYGDYNVQRQLTVLPDITVESGEYIVIHVNDASTSETDATGDTNGNGYWDVYIPTAPRTTSGFYASDAAFWVTENDGTTWMDFMIFSDRNGTFSSNLPGYYDVAESSGYWNPDSAGFSVAEYENNCAYSGDIESGVSIQRTALAAGSPTDTNSKDDWESNITSEGDGYFIPVSITGKLKVENSPFFPRGDNSGKPVMGRITYRLASADHNLTIAIYDIEGNIRKYLLHDHALTSAQGGVTWDGTDEYGDLVPVGIYIVSLKAYNRSTGGIQKEQSGIIVGRKF